MKGLIINMLNDLFSISPIENPKGYKTCIRIYDIYNCAIDREDLSECLGEYKEDYFLVSVEDCESCYTAILSDAAGKEKTLDFMNTEAGSICDKLCLALSYVIEPTASITEQIEVLLDLEDETNTEEPDTVSVIEGVAKEKLNDAPPIPAVSAFDKEDLLSSIEELLATKLKPLTINLDKLKDADKEILSDLTVLKDTAIPQYNLPVTLSSQGLLDIFAPYQNQFAAKVTENPLDTFSKILTTTLNLADSTTPEMDVLNELLKTWIDVIILGKPDSRA